MTTRVTSFGTIRLIAGLVTLAGGWTAASGADEAAEVSSPWARPLPELSELPVQVQELVEALRGVEGGGYRYGDTIVSVLGPPTRTWGSGILHDVWELETGTVGLATTMPQAVPTFRGSEEDSPVFELVAYSHPVSETLRKVERWSPNSIYEGVRLSNTVGGTSLLLRPSGDYVHEEWIDRFTNGIPRRIRVTASANLGSDYFLRRHPVGTFKFDLELGIEDETGLETLADGTQVGSLELASEDGTETHTYPIITDTENRYLVIVLEPSTGIEFHQNWRRRL